LEHPATPVDETPAPTPPSVPHAPPVIVEPRWFDIIMRSVETASRSASLNSIRQLYLMAELAQLKRHDDVEVRFILDMDGELASMRDVGQAGARERDAGAGPGGRRARVPGSAGRGSGVRRGARLRAACSQVVRLSDRLYTANIYAKIGVSMSKTLIDVDDELLNRARQLIGPKTTKREAVNVALSRFVRMHAQREAVDWIADNDPVADLRDPVVKAAARR